MSAEPQEGPEPDARPRIVLYRCPNPTNVLCPCGAVARRLGRLDLAYRTERVPYRRAARPEIEELTRQKRVPVLVDGAEVVHDSKRIIQYLEWKYGEDAQADEEVPAATEEAPAATEEAPAATGGEPRRPRLYNVKRWIRRNQQ